MSTTSQHRLYLPGTTLEALCGERVRVRPFTYEDMARRAKWPRFEEPEFSHLNIDLSTEARRQIWFRQRMRHRGPFWLAIDTLEGEMVGEESLREVDVRRKVARLGIHLSPAHIGRGFGTDAVCVMLRYFFDHLHFVEMKLDVAAHNRRAIRSYEKLNFEVRYSFWQNHHLAFQILTDERCVHLRPYVRRDGALEVMKFWEMGLTAERYHREVVPAASAADRHNHKPEDV